MRFVLQVIAILALAFALELFLPWYCIAFAAFIAGYFLKSKANFLAGFAAIALLWWLKAWMIDAHAASNLTERMAQLFPVHTKFWLMVLTASIGGLVGGFAALTGSLLRMRKKRLY
jgi:cell division protein FtsX